MMSKNLLLTFFICWAAFFSTTVQAQMTLRDTFKDYFLIGAALNQTQIYEKDKIAEKIVKNQFNTISPENILKWEAVHPKEKRNLLLMQ